MSRAILRLTLAAVVVLSSAHADAARRRAVTPRSDSSLVLTVSAAEFPASPDGVLDVGAFRWSEAKTGRRTGGATVTHRIAVRAERASGLNGGTVLLRAWIDDPASKLIVRVDGVELSHVPRVLRTSLVVGKTEWVRIECELPPSEPQGAVVSAIAWDATNN